MRIVTNRSTDPYFNLAAEEYFLEECAGDFFCVWRNDRSVIVGKNQNAWAQVDAAFARENGVAVVRRLTGGGAVFHDLGNVNYTFVTGGSGIDFASFAAPILRALASFGVNAHIGGRNDLIADGGAKISGNAACVRPTAHGERRIHHGTLLFSADLSEMERVLTPDPEKLSSKGIASVKSRVANIRDLTPALGDVDAAEFLELLVRFGEREFGAKADELTADEKAAISRLADEKYRTWEWNFGASPAFEFTRSRRFPYGRVTVEMTAARGVIEDVAITGDFFSQRDVSALCARLRGARLDRVFALLSDAGDFIEGASADDIAPLFCP